MSDGFITKLKGEWQTPHPGNPNDELETIHRALEGFDSGHQCIDSETQTLKYICGNRSDIQPPLSANHAVRLFFKKIAPPGFAPLIRDSANFSEIDIDGNETLSPIEMTLHAYAVQDFLQQMISPQSDHSIQLFIRNLSALTEKKISPETGLLWNGEEPLPAFQDERIQAILEDFLEGRMNLSGEVLIESAKQLLITIQNQLREHPEDRNLWLQSFQTWDALLELTRIQHPKNYWHLLEEYSNYYSFEYYVPKNDSNFSQKALPPHASEYLHLFHYMSHLRWISAQLFQIQKKIHTRSMGPKDWTSLFQIFAHRVHDIHRLAELRMEGLRSHEFLIKNFGYHPNFFSEEVLNAQSCPQHSEENKKQGKDVPYNVVESFKEWCNCFCSPLFGQHSARGSIASRIANNPTIQERLNPYWERFMRDPSSAPEVQEEIMGFAKSFEAKLSVLSRPTLTRIALDSFLAGRLGPKDWHEPLERLRTRSVTIYAHRVDSQKSLDRAISSGFGGELDVSYTRDGKWVLNHELQMSNGVYVIDLSSTQLKPEGIPLLEEIRAGSGPIVIDDKTNIYHPHANLKGAAQELISSLKSVGDNILIDSVNPDFLAELRQEISNQGLKYRLAYFFMEYASLKDFSHQVKRIPEDHNFPFEVLLVYGKDLRRLQAEESEALKSLRHQFKIVIAEDDPRAVADLQFDGLIAAGLPGIAH